MSFESPLRMFTGLVSGGSIRVYSEPKSIKDLALADVLREDIVNGLATTPSELRLLVGQDWSVSQLRNLIVIGEPLQRDLAVAAQKSLGPAVSIENWYGPTEATMASTMHRFDVDKDHGATVPIGHPAPDVSIHVLDQAMNPVPAGVIGEIYIGGARLSNGYLNSPELTKERFIPDPFLANQQLYRTGDLGRINRQGELVHHGRTDDQVKINGVRIELAEVECALLTHPRITACVAALTKDDPRLAAWFVADADIPVAELRSAVAQQLSSAMIPTLFSRIEAIPLNSNGKVDRKALPPIQSGAQQDIKVIAPRTKTEKAIAEIWRDILGIEEIGVDDNFTLLGGDSLALIKMVLAVEEKFDGSLSINSLNQIDTIAKLACLIDGEHLTTDASSDADIDQQEKGLTREMRRQLKIISIGWQGKSSSPSVPIYSLNTQGHLPPLFWCFNAAHEFPEMATELGSNQPIYGMRSLNQVIKDKKERRHVEPSLARIYAKEIQRLYPEGPYLVGGNCQGGFIAAKIAQALIDDGAPVLLLCLLDFVPATAYPGDVSLFFGRESTRFNPFFKSDTPEIGWKQLFGGVAWDIIPGNHGKYFSKPNVTPFCTRLTARIAEAHDGKINVSSQSPAARKQPPAG